MTFGAASSSNGLGHRRPIGSHAAPGFRRLSLPARPGAAAGPLPPRLVALDSQPGGVLHPDGHRHSAEGYGRPHRFRSRGELLAPGNRGCTSPLEPDGGFRCPELDRARHSTDGTPTPWADCEARLLVQRALRADKLSKYEREHAWEPPLPGARPGAATPRAGCVPRESTISSAHAERGAERARLPRSPAERRAEGQRPIAQPAACRSRPQRGGVDRAVQRSKRVRITTTYSTANWSPHHRSRPNALMDSGPLPPPPAAQRGRMAREGGARAGRRPSTHPGVGSQATSPKASGAKT